jgi:hypothetical protein
MSFTPLEVAILTKIPSLSHPPKPAYLGRCLPESWADCRPCAISTSLPSCKPPQCLFQLKLSWLTAVIHSTGLKQACPKGIFVSLTPGDASLWSGVIFVRSGRFREARPMFAGVSVD